MAVLFLENAGDGCRKDGAAFFAESTFGGVLAPDMGLLAAAAVLKDFSQIRISESGVVKIQPECPLCPREVWA